MLETLYSIPRYMFKSPPPAAPKPPTPQDIANSITNSTLSLLHTPENQISNREFGRDSVEVIHPNAFDFDTTGLEGTNVGDSFVLVNHELLSETFAAVPHTDSNNGSRSESPLTQEDDILMDPQLATVEPTADADPLHLTPLNIEDSPHSPPEAPVAIIRLPTPPVSPRAQPDDDIRHEPFFDADLVPSCNELLFRIPFPSKKMIVAGIIAMFAIAWFAFYPQRKQ